jgi:cGMP-specific 3',5'-cyclic phosphodiesterase
MENSLRVPSFGDSTESAISEYLSLNPGFVRDWFVQNVDKDTMESWLLEADEIQRQQAARRIESRTSITTAMFQNLISGKSRKVTPQQRYSKEQLLSMNEREVFMELIKDISNELDVDTLCHKILLNVSILTKSDRGSLFLVRGYNNNKYLVSKLFDVSENASLEECLHTEDNHIRVPFGTGIAGTVAQTKETIRIEDAYLVSCISCYSAGQNAKETGL